MISGRLQIRRPRREELRAVIERLDQEFIHNKNRCLSLSKRFPNTLSVENIDRVLIATTGGGICGVLAIRNFEWIVQQQTWPGAMIGMVWVDTHYRGKGIGSSLISTAAQVLHETNVAFGVLWTGSPAFYEPLGWCLNDRSLFGEAVTCDAVRRFGVVSCRPVASEDVTLLEHLRSCFLTMRVGRNTVDYSTLPVPAIEVLCFSARGADGEGFALVGEGGGIAYMYEMVAPPSLWGTIWSAVTERFVQIFVNGHSQDPFSQWLGENGLVIWQPQQKTMWMRLSDQVEESSINVWQIPYFDRI